MMSGIIGIGETMFYKIENDRIVTEQKMVKDHFMSKDWPAKVEVTIKPRKDFEDVEDKPYGESGAFSRFVEEFKLRAEKKVRDERFMAFYKAWLGSWTQKVFMKYNGFNSVLVWKSKPQKFSSLKQYRRWKKNL